MATCTLFFYSLQVKNGFYILKGLEKKKKEGYVTQIVYGSQSEKYLLIWL